MRLLLVGFLSQLVLILIYLYYGNKVVLPVAQVQSITKGSCPTVSSHRLSCRIRAVCVSSRVRCVPVAYCFLWDRTYAAYGIGVQVLSFSFVIGFSFSIAGATVGQHLGAGDNGGARKVGWRALWLSMFSMVLFGIAIAAYAEEIARYLIADHEVVRLTVVFIYIMALVQPLMAVEFTLGGCLSGAVDTRFPLIETMVGLAALGSD